MSGANPAPCIFSGRVQHSSFEEEVPNIRQSSLCHGEYVWVEAFSQLVRRQKHVSVVDFELPRKLDGIQ